MMVPITPLRWYRFKRYAGTDSPILSLYRDLPKIYAFKSQRDKEIMLNRNFKKVNDEVECMIRDLLGKPKPDVE